MDNMFYFEVPYECECEVCKKKFGGIIKRGPLQIGSNVLTTGMQSGLNTSEMKVSKKLIENDIENRRSYFFTVDNNAICPSCNARQSWNPITPPAKPSYIGLYIAAIIGFGLLGMLIWAIFFFDAFIPFAILEGIAIFLGTYLPHKSQKKNQAKQMEEYEKQNKEYIDFAEEIKKRETKNKPEIDWSKAVHIPVK